MAIAITTADSAARLDPHLLKLTPTHPQGCSARAPMRARAEA